jgi:hypothetical protein
MQEKNPNITHFNLSNGLAGEYNMANENPLSVTELEVLPESCR